MSTKTRVFIKRTAEKPWKDLLATIEKFNGQHFTEDEKEKIAVGLIGEYANINSSKNVTFSFADKDGVEYASLMATVVANDEAVTVEMLKQLFPKKSDKPSTYQKVLIIGNPENIKEILVNCGEIHQTLEVNVHVVAVGLNHGLELTFKPIPHLEMMINLFEASYVKGMLGIMTDAIIVDAADCPSEQCLKNLIKGGSKNEN